MKIIASILILKKKVLRRVFMFVLKYKFRTHGKNFVFDPYGQYTYENISIGDDVFIGNGATLIATNSAIIFKNKIMLGPKVTIMGGDHNTSELGVYMFDQKHKRPEDDQEVVIENDVWIGTGAIILKGVTIGQGSIVAAGSVVTKNVAPNSIVGGVPAKFLKNRFTDEELKKHLEILKSKK